MFLRFVFAGNSWAKILAVSIYSYIQVLLKTQPQTQLHPSTMTIPDLVNILQTDAPVPGQTTSKDVRWYTKELPKLDPHVRELLENYSHIPPEDVESHILKFVGHYNYFTYYIY